MKRTDVAGAARRIRQLTAQGGEFRVGVGEKIGGGWGVLLEHQGRLTPIGVCNDFDVARTRCNELRRELFRPSKFGGHGQVGTIVHRRLYKYLPEQYAKRLVDGHVYVSPSWRFKYSDVLSPGQIDDEMEKRTLASPYDIEGVVGVNDGGEFGRYKCVGKKELVANLPAYCLWCVSGALCPTLLADFDSEVVVEIRYLAAFADRLNDAVAKRLGRVQWWHATVDYESHHDYIGYGHYAMSVAVPHFLKGRQYESQHEYRFVWLCDEDVDVTGPFEVFMGSNQACARILDQPRRRT